MANNRRNNSGNNQQGIVNSWSLMAFARTHGRMQVAPFTNDDGEEFHSCVFTKVDANGQQVLDKDGKPIREFVGFSSNLGELTAKEIASQKADLQVVELESGYKCLCKQGNDTWDDVDLGI